MRLRPLRYARLPLNSAEESKVVPIVGDAAIATVGIGHGRLIPLIIINTTERPDLAEVIRVQAHFSEGDVVVHWGQLAKRSDHVALVLQFTRPTARVAVIEFDIATQGVLVEHTLIAQALYIQAGKPGDRLVHDLNLPKMLIEVPDTGFRPHWDKLYRDTVIKRMTDRGLTRKAAKSAADSFIDAMRGAARFRM